MKKDVSEELKEQLEEAQKEYVENILSEEGQKSVDEIKNINDNEATKVVTSLDEDKFIESQKEYVENILSEEKTKNNNTEQQAQSLEKDYKKIKNKYITKISILVVAICFVLISIISILVKYNKDGVLKLKEKDIKINEKAGNIVEEQEKIVDDWSYDKKKIFGIDEKTKIEKQQEEVKKIIEEKKTKEYELYENLTDEEKKKQQVIPRKEEIPYEEIDKIEKQEELPATFNLKDVINVKVENQGQFGLCWDFASTQSLQTHVALVDKKNIDLAEIHADYLLSRFMYGYRDIHVGGTFSDYKDYLSVSKPVNDQKLVYRDYSEITDYNYFLDIEKEDITATNTVSFPNIYKELDETEEEYQNRKKNLIQSMKTHIKNNGSLYAGVYAPDYNMDYYNSSTNALYYNGDYSLIENARGLHAISLVGWDDNYSRENFNSKAQPKNDGAFIALNSWGSNWGNNGYFYISYEDESVYNDVDGILSTSLDDAYNVDEIKNKKIRNIIDKQIGYTYIYKNNKTYVTKLALSKIKFVDLSNSNITDEDLKYVKLFSDASSINLSKNKITNISELSDLGVYTLDLSYNQIEDISPLKKIKNLYTLRLQNNKIKDVSALSDSSISELNLSGNDGIINFEKIKKLNKLILRKTNTSLDNILELENLNILDLSENNINNIKKLPSKLDSLILQNCDIKSIDQIPDCKVSFELDLSHNKELKDYSNLNRIIDESENKKMYYPGFELTLSNNNISDISQFNNINVEKLDLSNNVIKELNNYNNPNIKELVLSGNKNISNFDNLTNVRSLSLENCNIENVDDIVKLNNITNLNLAHNNIKDISLFDNMTNIYFLSLEDNKNIKGILNNKNITTLNISDCNLTNFDISKLSGLAYLNISNNNSFNDIVNLTKSINNKYANIVGNNMYITEKQISEIKDSIKDKYINLERFKLKVSIEKNNNYYDLRDSYIRYAIMNQLLFSNVNTFNNLIIDNKVTKATIISPNENTYINLPVISFDKTILISPKLIFD